MKHHPASSLRRRAVPAILLRSPCRPAPLALGLCLLAIVSAQLGCAEGQNTGTSEAPKSGAGAGGRGGAGGAATGAEGGAGGRGGAPGQGGAGGRGGASGQGGAGGGTPLRKPTGVAFSGLVNTAQYGNLDGGLPFNDACPPGQVVVGYTGFLSNSAGTHQRIQAVCAIVKVSESAPYHVELSPGAVLTSRGVQGSYSWSRSCPDQQMLVGFEGRSGDLVDQLVFRCADLVIDEAAGGYALSVGTISSLPPIGGSGGSAFATTDCPPGEVATVSNIRAGDSVDAFGIGCSTPSLIY